MSDAASATSGFRSSDSAAADYAWLAKARPLVPADRLYDLANRLRDSYRTAEPFPHVVIDNLFDDAMLDQLLAVFPGPKDWFWHRFDAEREVKLALDAEDVIPVPIRLFLYFLNGALFINFLEDLSGIPGLIPDPHWFGGGLHQIERHGKLAVHGDFNRHNRQKLDRRLNLLVYLNKDWKAEYRGDLELWDQDMTACVKKIAPLFNRMVIFSTTDFSYHGHPDELLCPPDSCRRSMALYYYSNGRPADELSEAHSTLFQPRPKETFSSNMRRRIKPFGPPILVDLYDRFTA